MDQAPDDHFSAATLLDLGAVAPDHDTDGDPGHPDASDLLPLLTNLDRRLAAAVQVADGLFAARAAGDLYRGLVITPADVDAALARTPGRPFALRGEPLAALAEATASISLRRLRWLQQVHGLIDLDLELLLIGLAPEIDLKYERLYAYLQDDVTRRRPSIDLALNLLCTDAGDKLRARGRFGPDSPLVHHRLIEILALPEQPHGPFLARPFRVDEQVLRFVLLDDSLDPRLAESCRVWEPAERRNDALLDPTWCGALDALAQGNAGRPIRLCLHGPADCGQTETLARLAAALDLRVLEADLSAVGPSVPPPAADTQRAIPREAWLRGCLLHLRLPASWDGADDGLAALWTTLEALPVQWVVESRAPWVPGGGRPGGVLAWEVQVPDTDRRARCWSDCLAEAQRPLDGDLPQRLAARYRLSYAQIRAAARGALALPAAYPGHGAGQDPATGLAAAARAQTRHRLAGLAVLIEPRATWADLVLPDDALAQIEELCARFTHRETVLEHWGFGRKFSYGKGISALFAGPSGTGKTMAAEVVANALGLDLFRVDLAAVVSKYIGETEKNLERIFTAAEQANTILFFDEADALFGKRSEVRDAHDRYANLEISYLLQRMERYDGIAILATNLRQNLDESFVRRLGFVLQFPFPDEAMRRRIWQAVWPDAFPLDTDLDLDQLARLKLSGGEIRNTALAAAYLASAERTSMGNRHVRVATQRTMTKLGKQDGGA